MPGAMAQLNHGVRKKFANPQE